MDDDAYRPDRTREEARYWTARTAFEAVKFAAWAAALTLHALAAAGWTPHL